MSNTDLPTPGLRFLLEIEAELEKLTTIGPTPGGEIRLIPIVGGTFEGAEVRGTILPGGADWQDVRTDGSLEISARYLLQSDQNELLEVRSTGLRAASPEVLAQLARGERVSPSAYYFRTAVRFRTGAPRLARLNDVLAVTYGQRRGQSVHLHVYEVL